MTTLVPLTLDEYEAFLMLPENLDRRFERIHGEIVERHRTQARSDRLTLASFHLSSYLNDHSIGFALIGARYRSPEDDHNDLIPDLSFVTNARVITNDAFAPYMPDLAVEVQSRGQSDRFMLDKAQLYLAKGTRMVWIIYSNRILIEVLTATDRQLLTANDIISGGEVLPGFSVAVREMFPPPSPSTP